MTEFLIVIKEEAESDLNEIFDYYEAQRNGLDIEFLTSFENILERLKRSPFHTLKINSKIRRAITEKFPYNIL